MSINNALSNALSGLGANSKLISITSNNLANALTEGYGRQIVNLGSQVLDGQPGGVTVVGVDRVLRPELTGARRQADADAGAVSAQADGMARLARGLGETGDENTLQKRIDGLERAFRNLSETPESEPRQIAAADAARDLADAFNDVAENTLRAREIADGNIAQGVDTVNRNLLQIADLNRKIVRLNAGGRDVAGLVDQREHLIDEISVLIPTRQYDREGGAIHLTTTEGLTLVDSSANQLGFTANPVMTAALAYDPAGGGALSGLTLAGVDITPGSLSSQQIDSGALAGYFRTRDTDAPALTSRIDELAADLVARFEDPAVDPTLGAADPGLFTDSGAQLDPLNIAGLAGRIQINSLVDQSAGGDASLLRDGLLAAGPGPLGSDAVPRAMLDALTVRLPAGAIPGLAGNLSSSEMASAITELTGTLRVSLENDAAALNTTRETLALGEAEAIGVDTDIELQRLIQIEQAFAANVQVIETAQRMLDEILEI